MTYVLNLTVQHNSKELSNDESYWNSEDGDQHIKGPEAISKKPFGEIFHRLQKLIIAINHSPMRIHHYKNFFNELEMPNIIVEDVRTRRNSTYDMIKATWEKKRSVEGNDEQPSKHK